MAKLTDLKIITLADIPPEHFHVFNALTEIGTGWGWMRTSEFLRMGGDAMKRQSLVTKHPELTEKHWKAAGIWLGERVFHVDRPLTGLQYGVRFKKGRWYEVASVDIAFAKGILRSCDP